MLYWLASETPRNEEYQDLSKIGGVVIAIFVLWIIVYAYIKSGRK